MEEASREQMGVLKDPEWRGRLSRRCQLLSE